MCWWLFIARHSQGQSSPTRSLADQYWVAAIVGIMQCLGMQPTFRCLLCKAVYDCIRPKIVPGAGLAYIQRGTPKFINHAKRLEMWCTQILSELQPLPKRKSISNQKTRLTWWLMYSQGGDNKYY